MFEQASRWKLCRSVMWDDPTEQVFNAPAGGETIGTTFDTGSKDEMKSGPRCAVTFKTTIEEGPRSSTEASNMGSWTAGIEHFSDGLLENSSVRNWPLAKTSIKTSACMHMTSQCSWSASASIRMQSSLPPVTKQPLIAPPCKFC